MAACPLAAERVWIEKSQYQDAEQKYFEHLSKVSFLTHVELYEIFVYFPIYTHLWSYIYFLLQLQMCSHLIRTKI